MNRLERWMYRFRVKPFFRNIIFFMAGVYALELFTPRTGFVALMTLYMPAVYSGQLWRLVTFLFIPPMGNPLTALLSLYFYYFIGTTLEARWGARRFLLFYLIGALAAMLAGVLTGIGTNQYLHMSMFFAFAVLQPDLEVLLFFVLPVKMKWLALLNAAFYVYSFINGFWPVRVAILLSLVNIALFFGGDIINLVRSQTDHMLRRQQFRNMRR